MPVNSSLYIFTNLRIEGLNENLIINDRIPPIFNSQSTIFNPNDVDRCKDVLLTQDQMC